MKHQLELDLLTADYHGFPVLFQPDGYISATQVAKRYEKEPYDFLQTKGASRKVKQIQEKLGLQSSQVVITLSGSPSNGGGTWFHPKLAVTFATWLDNDFAWWVEEQIEAILKADAQPKISTSERMLLDRLALNPIVLPGYFPVLNECTPTIMKMVFHGLQLDRKTLPDASIGRRWSDYWTQNKLFNSFGERKKFDEIPHHFPPDYPQSKGVDKYAWFYPEESLPAFRRWLLETYEVIYLPKYAKDKENQGALPSGSAEMLARITHVA